MLGDFSKLSVKYFNNLDFLFLEKTSKLDVKYFISSYYIIIVHYLKSLIGFFSFF